MLRPPPISTLFPYTTLFRSVVFLGPPGTGKTHLSLALTVKALSAGYSALFTTLTHLAEARWVRVVDRKSTRLNSSHVSISYAVFCLKKKNNRLVNMVTLSSV